MIYDLLLEGGLYALLGFATLALGGVSDGAVLIQELLAALLALAYLLKHVTPAGRRQAASAHHRSRAHHVSAVLLVIIVAMLALPALQRVPLPYAVTQALSPMSAQLSAEAAHTTGAAVPAWIPVSVARQATWNAMAERMIYGIMLVLSLHTFRSPKTWRRLLWVLLAFGFAQALYGLLHAMSGAAAPSLRWAHGTFVNKNHFAGYLELTIPLAFAALILQRERVASQQRRSPGEQAVKMLLLAGFSLLAIAALVLSGSRGGLISFSAGLVVFTLLAVRRGLMNRRLAGILLLAGVIAAVLLAANLDRIRAHGDELEHAVRIRAEIWKSAWHIFQDFPVAGAGLGTYSHLSRRYRTFQGVLFFEHAHNDYIEYLAETGVVGASLLLLAACWLAWRLLAAWQAQRSVQALAVSTAGLSALVSMAVHSVMDFNLHIPANAMLACMVAALTYNAARSRKTKRADSQAPAADGPARRQKPAAAALRRKALVGCALAALLGYSAQTGLRFRARLAAQAASSAMPEHFMELDAARHERLLSDLQTAARFAPARAEYAHALGRYMYKVLTGTNPLTNPPLLVPDGLSGAERWITRAILLDPANPHYYYSLGQLHYSRGACHHWRTLHPGESWDACPVTVCFAAALRNAPAYPFYREAFARWYAAYDRDEARRRLRALLAKDDPDAPIDQGPRDLARLYYDFQMDPESDALVARFWPDELPSHAAVCQATIILESVPERAEIVLGSDDGTPEWRTELRDETDRISKRFCLPADGGPYQEAGLLVYLNRNASPDGGLLVGVDAEQWEIAANRLPEVPGWHEIPLDASLVEGKSELAVYLRARGPDGGDAAIAIGGDADAPGVTSGWNFRGGADRSAAPGMQRGEYLIRLRLRSSAPSPGL